MSVLDKTSFSSGRPEVPPHQMAPHSAPNQKSPMPAPHFMHKDTSVFGGKSFITEKQFVHDLHRKLRGEIKREIGSADPRKINQAISHLEETVKGGNKKSVITPRDGKKIIDYAHHQEVIHTKERSKDGFTYAEAQETRREKGLIGFLVRKFGSPFKKR